MIVNSYSIQENMFSIYFESIIIFQVTHEKPRISMSLHNLLYPDLTTEEQQT